MIHDSIYCIYTDCTLWNASHGDRKDQSYFTLSMLFRVYFICKMCELHFIEVSVYCKSWSELQERSVDGHYCSAGGRNAFLPILHNSSSPPPPLPLPRPPSNLSDFYQKNLSVWSDCSTLYKIMPETTAKLQRWSLVGPQIGSANRKSTNIRTYCDLRNLYFVDLQFAGPSCLLRTLNFLKSTYTY
jgi:hypothetical protein